MFVLIMSLRTDFYGRALQYRPLADALQGNVQSLGPMNRSELLEAIVRPAELAGASFENGLVDILLEGCGGCTRQLAVAPVCTLPVVEPTKEEVITHKSYAELGGIGSASKSRRKIF